MKNNEQEFWFLNISKANEVCSSCGCKKCINQNSIDETIRQNRIFLISENVINGLRTEDFSCAIMHYNQDCMKNCVCTRAQLEMPIESYCFWSYNLT
ncbi:hypothetical protein IJ843_00305 [bacterium]|nr:hypothetical protein [bacterium]